MKEFKEPNRKAPRVREVPLNILNDEFFSEFKKTYPECKSLSNTELRHYIKTINLELADIIANSRDGVELPTGLGYLFVGSCIKDVTKHKTDMFNSRNLGVVVGLKNLDSDEHLAKIFYTNSGAKYLFKYSTTWGFKGSRIFKNKVSTAFRQQWNKFRVVENHIKIASLFRKNYTRIKIKEDTSTLINDYNDLEI